MSELIHVDQAMLALTHPKPWPADGWVHAANVERFHQGSVFGWVEDSKLWSGIVEKVDHLHLRVFVKNVLPGVHSR